MKLKPVVRHALLLIPTFSFSASLVAEQTVELDEMTITSTRSDTQLKDSPQVVTVIGQEEIEQQMEFSSNTSQILSRLLPAFSPNRQKLSNAGESFRGRAPLFMIDGVPQSNPLRDGARDGLTIDLSMVERIEVIHGASAIHGLGATGGIINFITKRPSANSFKQRMSVSTTMPTEKVSDETLGYRGEYSLLGSQNDWEYALGLSYETQGQYLDGNGDVVGVDPYQGETMDSKSYDVFAKLGYWFDDNQNLELSINRFQLKGNNNYTAVDGDRDRGEPASSINQSPVGYEPYNRVLTSNLTYKHYDLAGMTFNAQIYRQEFEARYGSFTSGSWVDPDQSPSGLDQSQNESEKNGAKLTLSKDDLINGKLKLTSGIDLLEDTTEQRLLLTDRSYVPETTFKNYAPFIQAQIKPVDFLVLNTGLRYEHAELDVDTYQTVAGKGGVTVDGGNPDFSETLFNVGAVVSPTTWLSLFANYAEGFGMPDVGRVLRGIGTPGLDVDTLLDLKPIVTENREIGLRFNWAPIDFEISYYESDSDLGSRLQAVGNDFIVQREETEISGMEASLGLQVSDAHRVNLSYSHINGRSDSDDDGQVDRDLTGADIPPNRLLASWNASWSPKLNTFLQASHNFDRRFDENPELKFDGYTLVDAAVGYKLPVGKMNLAFTNLLNKDYFTYYSQSARSTDTHYYKGRGRTVTLGYSLDF
ncbi:TonB-dependent receptor [Methylophaga sp.]|uniref:TonB-dependent receptor n=1 Tax=Methylophaga sp. TaxID=2024840 RepID=UPI003F6A22F8